LSTVVPAERVPRTVLEGGRLAVRRAHRWAGQPSHRPRRVAAAAQAGRCPGSPLALDPETDL